MIGSPCSLPVGERRVREPEGGWECDQTSIFREPLRARTGGGFGSIAGSVAAVVVMLAAFPIALSSGGDGGQPQNATVAKVNLTMTYEAALSQYEAAVNPLSAAIATATTDIRIDDERLQSDATIYSSNEAGVGCSFNLTHHGYFTSCALGEDLTAQSAVEDERSADVARREAVSTQIKSIQTIESVISVFIQELDSIIWPSSVAPVASDLTQHLSQDREAYAKAEFGLAYGQPISAYTQSITANGSAVTAQLINMSTALHIP